MLNFLYVNYPYGGGEAFVEYEMRDFAEGQEELTIYVLRKSDMGKKRFVPERARIVFVENHSLRVMLLAFVKMFGKCTLKEIFHVLKSHYPEGTHRCLYRIYRYRVAAEYFAVQYRKLHKEKETNTFVSYWLNECAFALTELKKKYPHIKVVSRGHGYDVFEERCYMPFRKEILSGLDQIFLINRASQDYFEKQYGAWLDTSKIKISHLGVTLPERVNPKDDGQVFRVVTCSSVIPLKRLDLMIEALSGVTDKKIEWVHFGGGPLFEKMQSYAEEKLAESSVTYCFKGQVALQEVHDFYAKTPVHLFVNCSDTEGTPVSVMEAMAYGIPAVARNVGGMAEVLEESCGKLLPQEENAALLRETILEFASIEDAKYLKICENAREKIENEFNAKTTYKEYIESVFSL